MNYFQDPIETCQNIAVIGSGYWGKNLVRNLAAARGILTSHDVGRHDLPPLIGPNIMRVRRLLAARSLP